MGVKQHTIETTNYMQSFLLSSQPHRRFNILKGEWVLVSPHRNERPWQGEQEKVQEKRLLYDPICYLCPGNLRANGEKNPLYTSTYVFTNDFPALIDTPTTQKNIMNDIFQAETVQGTCRVVCFSPRHDLTLAYMSFQQIEQVIITWIAQIVELKKQYNWIQIFENKGSLMGCSNPHPHGQIWASNFIPTEIEKEDMQQMLYYKEHKSPLLVDYLHEELRIKQRIIAENGNWVVLIPYWAFWPFETLLLPKKHITSLQNLSNNEQKDLAKIMKQLLVSYYKLFHTSMPYSMGWHFAPFNKQNPEHWQLHAHFYPPLLRNATVKKFMVGYEMLAEPQRDVTAEQAAERLKVLI